jgi:hypothetical protein
VLAAIVTAILLAGPFQPTDASFDPGPKTQGGFEPSLGFAAFPPIVLRTWLGQCYLLHTEIAGNPLILFREDTPIRRREVGRTLE